MANKETKVTEEEETLSLYLIDEEEETEVAVVSIGHIDFRASFCFSSNEDAQACYDALLKVKDMNIN